MQTLAANAIRTPLNYNSNTIPAGDDTYSSVVNLPFTMNWNGTSYSTIYINMNGNCTFGNFSTAYDPTTSMATTNREMLAPFWADVDTRAGGGSSLVTYSNITAGNAPQINGHNAFMVNWINVGRYNASGPLNSFQLVLIDRSDTGVGNFDIEYNYNSILWDIGTSSSNSYARVGWARAGNSGYDVAGGNSSGAFLDSGPDSLTAGSLNSGGTLGRYVWNVRNGTPPNFPPVVTLGFTSKNLEANTPTGVTGYSGAGDATATDPDGTIASLVRSPASGATLQMGSNTILWTATDNLGAITTANQTINVVDTTPPTLPALSSSTHSINVWSKAPTIGMNWTDATDAASGLAGYSFNYTPNAAGLPDATMDSFTQGNGTTNSTLESQTFSTGTWPGDWAKSGTDPTFLRANNVAARSHGTYSAEIYSAVAGTRRTAQFTKTYDLSSFDSATLSFWDYATFAGGTDYELVDYSTNGLAGPWTTLRTNNTAGTYALAQRSVALPTGAGNSAVTLRFSGSVNGTTEFVNWDDILINTSKTVLNGSSIAPGDGRWYFNIRSVDNAGNWTTTASSMGPFLIDTTAPTTGSNIGAGWVNIAPTVTLSATDPLSGVAGTMVRTDVGTWNSYTVPFAYATDGIHTFDYYSTDTAGNIETFKTSTLKLDRTNPTTPASLLATASGGATALSWTAATDALSGIDSYNIYRGGVLVGNSSTLSFSDLVPGDGNYSYTVAAVDAAGNIGAQSIAKVIFVDATPPTLPTTFSSPSHPLVNHWYGPGAVTLNWNGATDAISGIGGYSYSWTANVAGLPDATTDSYTAGTPLPSPLENQTFATATWPVDWAKGGTDPASLTLTNVVARAHGTYAAQINTTSQNTRRTAQFTHTYDLSNYTSANLTWWDYLVGSAGGDYLQVDYSTTGLAGPWTTIRRDVTNGTVAWQQRSFNLPTGPGYGAVTLRFSGSVNRTNEYICFDDILLAGVGTTVNSTIVNPGDGKWHFDIRTVDGAGNWTPGAADIGQIWIDALAPVTASNIVNTWSSAIPTITLLPTDAESGVSSTMLRIDGGTYASYIGSFSYSTEGTHTFDFYSVDAVGNTEQVKSATLRLDRTAPGAAQNLAGGATSTTQVALVWNPAIDALSGIDYYRIYRDGTLVGTSTATSYVDTVLPGSSYQYYVIAVDAAGNVGPQSSPTQVVVPTGMLTLSVDTPTVDMGTTASGSSTSKVDAVNVTVTGVGNQSYTLSTSGNDFQNQTVGSATPVMSIANLQYQTRGQTTLPLRSFGTGSQTINTVSVSRVGTWNQLYTFDFQLNVPWNNESGVYNAVVTYTVIGN
jgi:hypothetical protein